MISTYQRLSTVYIVKNSVWKQCTKYGVDVGSILGVSDGYYFCMIYYSIDFLDSSLKSLYFFLALG